MRADDRPLRFGSSSNAPAATRVGWKSVRLCVCVCVFVLFFILMRYYIAADRDSGRLNRRLSSSVAAMTRDSVKTNATRELSSCRIYRTERYPV